MSLASKYEIKQATERDAGVLSGLYKELFGMDMTEATIIRNMNAAVQPVSYFMLKYRGRYIAMAVCVQATSGQSVIIDKVGIVAKQRRKGFGSALLSQVKGYYCAEGMTHMKLICRITNQAALLFCTSLGFAQLYVDENYYPKEPGVVMGTRLRGM